MSNDSHAFFRGRVLNKINIAEVPVAVADLVEVDGTVGLGRGVPGDFDSPGVIEVVNRDLTGSASGDVAEGLVDDGVRQLALAGPGHDCDSNLKHFIRDVLGGITSDTGLSIMNLDDHNHN